MNYTKLIKDDEILSYYSFDEVYIILLRLKHLGYICECNKEHDNCKK